MWQMTQMTQRVVPAEKGPQKLMLLKPFLLAASFKQLNCVSGIYRNNPIHSWLTTHAATQSREDMYGGLLDRFTQYGKMLNIPN